MSDLQRLLDDAATGTGPPPEWAADLGRARTALTRRRRRRYSIGLAGLSTAAVLAVGVVAVVSSDPAVAPGPAAPAGPGAPAAPAAPEQGGVRLVAETLEAGPYTFDRAPVGWLVQHVGPFGVTIAPADGSVDPDPDVFAGKLVILFDGNRLGSGRRTLYDQRRFDIGGDHDYTTISTPTLPGEPAGVVRVQFPDDAGWTIDVMLEFLAHVQVGAGARPGLG